MTRATHFKKLVFLALVGLMPLACSNKYAKEERRPTTNATLDGSVKYGTDTVAVALIIAQGATGSSQAFVGDDGKYHLENVPLGEIQLSVNTDAGKGNMMSRVMSQSQGKAKAIPRVLEVPKKFADPTKSGIKTTIKEGPNTFDIVIPR